MIDSLVVSDVPLSNVVVLHLCIRTSRIEESSRPLSVLSVVTRNSEYYAYSTGVQVVADTTVLVLRVLL